MSVRRHAQILAHAFAASIGSKKRKKEIRKGNMSLLECRAVKVVKSKKKNAFKKNRKCKKQTHAGPILKNTVVEL